MKTLFYNTASLEYTRLKSSYGPTMQSGRSTTQLSYANYLSTTMQALIYLRLGQYLLAFICASVEVLSHPKCQSRGFSDTFSGLSASAGAPQYVFTYRRYTLPQFE